MLWLLAACTPDPTPVTMVPPTPAVGGERTELTTRDGVDLVADVYPGAVGSPAVLLLHMTPVGGWSRTDWPAALIDPLVERGWWVVALDRRGAGESGGVAEDAFTGETGRYDTEAAAVWLQDEGAGSLAVIGASNGTTSALDYAVWAGAEGLPEPVALGFMTGGAYTENQVDVTTLSVPAVFTYSTAERDWSTDLVDSAPSSWTFHEYPDGAHGTRMFEAAPEVVGDLLTFLDGVL